MDKVLPGRIIDCAIQINFKWMQLIKDGSCYIVDDINPSKFCPG